MEARKPDNPPPMIRTVLFFNFSRAEEYSLWLNLLPRASRIDATRFHLTNDLAFKTLSNLTNWVDPDPGGHPKCLASWRLDSRMAVTLVAEMRVLVHSTTFLDIARWLLFDIVLGGMRKATLKIEKLCIFVTMHTRRTFYPFWKTSLFHEDSVARQVR